MGRWGCGLTGAAKGQSVEEGKSKSELQLGSLRGEEEEGEGRGGGGGGWDGGRRGSGGAARGFK